MAATRKGKTVLKRFLKDRRGATGIEYGLIISLICLVLVAAAGGFARQLDLAWRQNAETIEATVNK